MKIPPYRLTQQVLASQYNPNATLNNYPLQDKLLLNLDWIQRIIPKPIVHATRYQKKQQEKRPFKGKQVQFNKPLRQESSNQIVDTTI